MPVHTAVYASLAALLIWALALSTTRLRIRHKVFVGDGGIPELQRMSRAHGVSLEHLLPLLILLLLLELLGSDHRLVDAFGVSILVSRLLNVSGRLSKNSRLGVTGMTLTYALEPLLAFTVLAKATRLF